MQNLMIRDFVFNEFLQSFILFLYSLFRYQKPSDDQRASFLFEISRSFVENKYIYVLHINNTVLFCLLFFEQNFQLTIWLHKIYSILVTVWFFVVHISAQNKSKGNEVFCYKWYILNYSWQRELFRRYKNANK